MISDYDFVYSEIYRFTKKNVPHREVQTAVQELRCKLDVVKTVSLQAKEPIQVIISIVGNPRGYIQGHKLNDLTKPQLSKKLT